MTFPFARFSAFVARALASCVDTRIDILQVIRRAVGGAGILAGEPAFKPAYDVSIRALQRLVAHALACCVDTRVDILQMIRPLWVGPAFLPASRLSSRLMFPAAHS
jgi:hypothetical protein